MYELVGLLWLNILELPCTTLTTYLPLLADINNRDHHDKPSDITKLQASHWTEFRANEWYRRGWTLQELIAPKHLVFFDSNWRQLGDRSQLAALVHEITDVATDILRDGYDHRPCVADIVSWAAGGQTTRIENRAYSLLGLFGISMPLLYGEGDVAFLRLQEEILRRNDDQSIFAWSGSKHIARQDIEPGHLARSPIQFSPLPNGHSYLPPARFPRRAAHSITNEGISLQLQLTPIKPRVYLALLNAIIAGSSPDTKELSRISRRSYAVVYLKRIDPHRYARWAHELTPTHLDLECVRAFKLLSEQQSTLRQIIVVNSLKQHEMQDLLVDRLLALKVSREERSSTNNSGITVHMPKTPASGTALTMDRLKDDLACHIDLKPYGRKADIPYIRVKSLGFKFDFDLHPICIIGIDWPDQDHDLHAAVSRVAFQNAQYSTDPFPSGPELSLQVIRGEWRNESKDEIAIRHTIDCLFEDANFLVTIHSRRKGRPGGVVNVSLSEEPTTGTWLAKITTSIW